MTPIKFSKGDKVKIVGNDMGAWNDRIATYFCGLTPAMATIDGHKATTGHYISVDCHDQSHGIRPSCGNKRLYHVNEGNLILIRKSRGRKIKDFRGNLE
jgi:hypothetical protein